MIKITFPNNIVKEYPEGITGFDLLKDYKTDKEVLCISVNEEIYDLSRPINFDAIIKFNTFEDPEGKILFGIHQLIY